MSTTLRRYWLPAFFSTIILAACLGCSGGSGAPAAAGKPKWTPPPQLPVKLDEMTFHRADHGELLRAMDAAARETAGATWTHEPYSSPSCPSFSMDNLDNTNDHAARKNNDFRLQAADAHNLGQLDL